MKRSNLKFQPAFTIVELLVVIVVIAILAVIAFVSYSGISNKATVTSLQSDLAQASKQLKLYQVEYGQYPQSFAISGDKYCPDAPTADNRYCFKASSGNSFTYTYLTPQTFNLNSSKSGTAYRITQDTSPTLYTGIGGIDQYTKLMLHGEDLSDSSGLNKTAIIAGGASVSSAQSKFGGKSFNFSGASQRVYIPSDADFNMGTGDFTLSGWLYFSDTGQNKVFMSLGTFGVGELTLQTDNTANCKMTLIVSNSLILTESTSSSINTWYYYELVKSSGTYTLYKDGVNVGSVANNVAINPTASPNIWIGYSSYVFSGYVDEVKIDKGIARHTSNFTPPTQPYSN